MQKLQTSVTPAWNHSDATSPAQSFGRKLMLQHSYLILSLGQFVGQGGKVGASERDRVGGLIE